MRLDDIAADLLARNAAFVAALSTPELPLVALTADRIILREYQEPTGAVSVFLDALQEEVEELAPSFHIVALPVEFTVFTIGGTETEARERASRYASAFLSCLRGNPDYFQMTRREDFEGVEGKPGIKATKVAMLFKFEEQA